MPLRVSLLLLLLAAPAADALDLLSRPPDRERPETRMIPFGQGPRERLLEGWSENEWNGQLLTHFVWAEAREASVSFTLLDIREQQFLVRLVPATPGHAQEITVVVNGNEVTRFVPEPTWLEYRFVVPAEALRRGENRLTFRHAVLDDSPRPLAAAYTLLLFGPNCVRLRPTGRPEPPPLVRLGDGGLFLRGPVEIAYRLGAVAGRVLELGAVPGKKPANVSVRWLPAGEAERGREIAELRIERGWFGNGEQLHRIRLPPDASAPGELRLEVLPDGCRDAATETTLTTLRIREREAD